MPESNWLTWIINTVIGVGMLVAMAICSLNSINEIRSFNLFSPIGGFIVLLLSIWFLWTLFVDFTMSITVSGISRRLKFKTVTIPWSEVTSVAQQAAGVQIRIDNRKVKIPNVRYRLKSDELYNWIVDKIPDYERKRILST